MISKYMQFTYELAVRSGTLRALRTGSCSEMPFSNMHFAHSLMCALTHSLMCALTHSLVDEMSAALLVHYMHIRSIIFRHTEGYAPAPLLEQEVLSP